jgi:hypothetical protein
LWRLRYVLLVGWGVLWMLPPSSYTLGSNNDWIPFEIGARTIVHYHGMWQFASPALHLFADTPMLQFGPLPVLLLAPFQVFAPRPVAIGFGVAMIVAGVAAMVALEAAARTLLPQITHRRLRVVTFVLELVLVPVWSFEVGYWHHLDDVLALLCVSLAIAVVARQGTWWAFGLLIGTAAATKPWAVLAAPLLLALPRPEWARAALVTMAAAAAWWAPFLVAAPATVHALGQYSMLPDPGSVLYLLGVHVNGAGWLRPLQLATGMTMVGLLVRRGRWQDALLAGVATRILLDPFSYSYYALGPMLGALLADLARVEERRTPRWTISTLALVWLFPRLNTHTPLWGVLAAPVHLPTLGAAARLVWALTVLAVLVAPRVAARAPQLRLREAPASTA